MSEIMHNFEKDFSEICLKKKNNIAIILNNEVNEKYYSYSDIYIISGKILSYFDKEKILPGDSVLSLLPNSVETIMIFFACLRGGYIFAPLPCNVKKREIDNGIEQIKPKIIFEKSEIDSFVNDDNSYIQKKISCEGDFEWLDSIKERTGNASISSSKIFLSTSGTTGKPKIMVIDGNKLWSSACFFSNYYNINELRFLNYLPMSYLGGLFNLALIPLSCKGSFVVTESFSGRTMMNFWNVIKQFEITAIWFVPTIVTGLLKIANITHNYINEYVCNKIKIAFVGTAPIKKSVKEEFEEKFRIMLYENYALSETTFLTYENRDNIVFRRESSVGEISKCVDMIFVGDENEEIKEIAVKTPFLFDGYLINGSLHSIMENEYFYTNDYGKIDEDGQVILLGRKRDIIKKGGMFVSLREIEVLAESLEFISEAAAVSCKHEFYGESYKLYFVVKPKYDKTIVVEKLSIWLHTNLVDYKLPEDIIMCDEFPRTESGKVKKGLLGEK